MAEVEPRVQRVHVCTPTGNELPEMVAHWCRLRDLPAHVPGRLPPRVQCPLCGGWTVEAYAVPKEVRALLVRRVPGCAAVVGQRGFYHLPRASLLGSTQRSPKAAERYLRRKAFEWAEMLSVSTPARD